MPFGGNQDVTHPWAQQGHEAPAPPAGVLSPLVFEAGIGVDTTANGLPERVSERGNLVRMAAQNVLQCSRWSLPVWW